jgi:hypothetical protein
MIDYQDQHHFTHTHTHNQESEQYQSKKASVFEQKQARKQAKKRTKRVLPVSIAKPRNEFFPFEKALRLKYPAKMRTKPVPTPPPNDATLPFLKYPITPPITITSPYGIVKQKSCIFPGFLGFQDQDFAGLSQIKQRTDEERKESSVNQLSLGDQK